MLCETCGLLQILIGIFELGLLGQHKSLTLMGPQEAEAEGSRVLAACGNTLILVGPIEGLQPSLRLHCTRPIGFYDSKYLGLPGLLLKKTQ